MQRKWWKQLYRSYYWVLRSYFSCISQGIKGVRMIKFRNYRYILGIRCTKKRQRPTNVVLPKPLDGLEPSTSSLPWMRSTNWAKAACYLTQDIEYRKGAALSMRFSDISWEKHFAGREVSKRGFSWKKGTKNWFLLLLNYLTIWYSTDRFFRHSSVGRAHPW